MANLQKEKPKLPSATIVIPTYQRTHLALKLAKQIRLYHPNLQIVIVDQENQATKDEKEINKYHIEYHQLDKANTSVAKNLGIVKAKGEIVIFFDDDVEITKDTINNHLKQYTDNKIVGVAGRVINDSDKIPTNTDVETGKTNWLGTRFIYQFWSLKKQIVDFVYGCNMSFRKSTLDQIGGFDENFPKVFEEVDLSARLKKHGDIIFEPDALVYHHKAPSGGIRPEEKNNKNKLIFENYGHYLAKNVLFPFSLITLFLRTVTAIKISISTVGALYKGYFKNLMLQLINLLKQNIWIILLFAIIIFLRLWMVPNFFIFTFSEEWQGTLAWEQVKNFHPIWIGVSQANINFYLGSGFIYLNYLLFLIKNGDLVVLAYFSALLGIATVIVLFFVVRDLFDRKIAFITSIFYGCSTLINYYDRRFWNPSFIPLISILYVYALIKTNKDTRWFILIAILTAASFHFHLLLLLFMIPTIYSVIKNFRKIKWYTWVLMVIFYLVIISPLIVFDLNHNFDNLLAPYKIIFEGKKTGLYSFSFESIKSHINSLVSTLGRIWFIRLNSNLQDIVLETNTYKIPGNIFLALISCAALFWFFIKNRKNGYQIFFISIVSILFAYIVYPSYNPEYYLMGFLTLFTIIIGFFLNSLPKKLICIVISFFILANLLTVLTTTNDYGLTMKKQFIMKTMSYVNNKTFSLETAGSLPNPQFAYAGWRLLFKIYGKTPARSNIDTELGWIYADEISKSDPELHVIVSENPLSLNHKLIQQFQEGKYYGYIYQNSR